MKPDLKGPVIFGMVIVIDGAEVCIPYVSNPNADDIGILCERSAFIRSKRMFPTWSKVYRTIRPKEVFTEWVVRKSIAFHLFTQDEINELFKALLINISVIINPTEVSERVSHSVSHLGLSYELIITEWLQRQSKIDGVTPDDFLENARVINFDILSKNTRRGRPIPKYMHFLRWVLKNYWGLKLKSIGHVTGTDHSTVIYSIKQVENDYDLHEKFGIETVYSEYNDLFKKIYDKHARQVQECAEEIYGPAQCDSANA